MQIILEINNKKDWAILLPLLERLKISYTQTVMENGANKGSGQKNFDVEKLEQLFSRAHSLGAFARMNDPLAWQKQIRDEWD